MSGRHFLERGVYVIGWILFVLINICQVILFVFTLVFIVPELYLPSLESLFSSVAYRSKISIDIGKSIDRIFQLYTLTIITRACDLFNQ